MHLTLTPVILASEHSLRTPEVRLTQSGNAVLASAFDVSLSACSNTRLARFVAPSQLGAECILPESGALSKPTCSVDSQRGCWGKGEIVSRPC